MKPELSKEYILRWVDAEIYSRTKSLEGGYGGYSTEEDVRVLTTIRFVLKHRTEENWGPKELTMQDAMRFP